MAENFLKQLRRGQLLAFQQALDKQGHDVEHASSELLRRLISRQDHKFVQEQDKRLIRIGAAKVEDGCVDDLADRDNPVFRRIAAEPPASESEPTLG